MTFFPVSISYALIFPVTGLKAVRTLIFSPEILPIDLAAKRSNLLPKVSRFGLLRAMSVSSLVAPAVNALFSSSGPMNAASDGGMEGSLYPGVAFGVYLRSTNASGSST